MLVGSPARAATTPVASPPRPVAATPLVEPPARPVALRQLRLVFGNGKKGGKTLPPREVDDGEEEWGGFGSDPDDGEGSAYADSDPEGMFVSE
jgi:hypothetical protein